MSFPRYSRYRSSGVEWLGEIPEHWGVQRLKRIGSVLPSNVDKKMHSGEMPIRLCNYTDVYYNERITDEIDFMEATASSEQVAKFALRAGDTVITKDSETADDIAVGAYVPSDLPGVVCGYHLAVVRPLPGTHGAFIKRLFDSSYAKRMVAVRANGLTRVGLGKFDLDNLPLPFPPQAEQERLVAFIDSETSKIEDLVKEQRRLMELLNEKREAVIATAVIRGLNPDAAMKSSGVEWLGDVPSHWQVCRLGNVFREVAEAGTDDLPILSVSIHDGVSDKEIDEEDMDRKVSRSEDRSKYKRVAPGDLVYNMMRAWQGGFGTVAVRGMVSPAYVVARPTRPLETAYIEHLLRTPQAIEQMRRHSRGVTDFRLRLYWDEFKNIRVALPPRAEAIAICVKLAEMEQRFSAMSEACAESIALLQERRVELISAAVTGQIDVRGIAVPGSV